MGPKPNIAVLYYDEEWEQWRVAYSFLAICLDDAVGKLQHLLAEDDWGRERAGQTLYIFDTETRVARTVYLSVNVKVTVEE